MLPLLLIVSAAALAGAAPLEKLKNEVQFALSQTRAAALSDLKLLYLLAASQVPAEDRRDPSGRWLAKLDHPRLMIEFLERSSAGQAPPNPRQDSNAFVRALSLNLGYLCENFNDQMEDARDELEALRANRKLEPPEASLPLELSQLLQLDRLCLTIVHHFPRLVTLAISRLIGAPALA